MKASDLFVKCLETEGVDYIFGIPGEENADFVMSLSESKIKFILTRHEQGAAFMADVYGRLTGKVGVCLATLGPGATNLVTGVANANMDRSRLLAITGQTDSHLLHKESHQNMDAITLFKPITKWNWSIRNPQNIPEIVRRAFKISLEEKPGATHIELPQDIAKKESDIPPIEPQPIFRSEANEQLIKQEYGGSKYITTGVKIIIYAVIIAIALTQLGVGETIIPILVAAFSWSIAAGIGAAIAIGLGFTFKDMFPAIINSASKQRSILKVGQKVKIGEDKGTITAVDLLHIILANENNESIIIPTKNLSNQTIRVFGNPVKEE
ncbi:MAG: thiamine pyrophosphate-binding protein [Nitrosopumilus sp.]|nr:thiamine pyrophosphate-binding protein [Nitrosopumilus sp.]